MIVVRKLRATKLSEKIDEFRLKYKIPADLHTIASSKGTLSINGKSVTIEKIGASSEPKKLVTNNAITPTTINQRYLNYYKNTKAPLSNALFINHAEQDNLG